MLVEYYEDWFEDDPHAVLDAMRGEDGEIVFDDLEDPLLAKWEHELAQGATPDLEEGMSDESRAKLAAERKKYETVHGKAADAATISEDFTKAAEKMNAGVPLKPDKRMESKFIAKGSLEDNVMSAAARTRRGAAGPVMLGEEAPRGRRR